MTFSESKAKIRNHRIFEVQKETKPKTETKETERKREEEKKQIMTGKFRNGQTKSDWRHWTHGNSHWADKKVGARESNNKHNSVGDGESYYKSQRDDGSSMYEVKKAAASNSKKIESIRGRSSIKHDLDADCTYAIDQIDTNAGHLYK